MGKLTSSINAFLSPVNLVTAGPSSCLLAATLSSFSEDRQRENTASPEQVDKKRKKSNYSYNLVHLLCVGLIDLQIA